MLDTLTFVAYMLGNEPGHVGHMHLFLDHPAQICQHPTQSPPVRWSGVPPEASSLVLIIKDEKNKLSSEKSRYYWVAYNLPVQAKGLPSDGNDQITYRDEGRNSWGQRNYHAPCSENSKSVVVELYALDKRFSAHHAITGKLMEQKIKGHVLAKTVMQWHVSKDAGKKT
jgi:Raf kinase inhibitor-like YbhB/YbcL family protein